MKTKGNRSKLLDFLSRPLTISAAVLLLGTVLIVAVIAAHRSPEPDAMSELYADAQEKYSLGQYDEALELYRQSISLYPHSETGYIGLYRTLCELEQYDEAARIFFTLPEELEFPALEQIRDDINLRLEHSYRRYAQQLGFILNENGTYIKTCTGKDFWYYGWCEKTGVLGLLIEDLDSDGITEAAALVIRSHEPDADIEGTFAFGLQSDAWLVIFDSDGTVHERLVARCFDSRQSFLDVYSVNGRIYIETGSKHDKVAARTYAIYEWTGTEAAAVVLLEGSGDTVLSLTDTLSGTQIFPGAYADGKEGYTRALCDILEPYGLTIREFGALEQACMTGGTRICLAAGGISGSPGMKLTGKCDCSLMSAFLGNGHFYAENPVA